jgi:hypothetical protein
VMDGSRIQPKIQAFANLTNQILPSRKENYSTRRV